MRSISLVVLGIFVGVAAVVTVTSFATGQPRLNTRGDRNPRPAPTRVAPGRAPTAKLTEVPAAHYGARVTIDRLDIYQAEQATFVLAHLNGVEPLRDGAPMWFAFATDPAIQSVLINHVHLQHTSALVSTATKSMPELRTPSLTVMVRTLNAPPAGCPPNWSPFIDIAKVDLYEIVRVQPW